MALGGGRGAVVRQLLIESVVLALCGAAAGVAAGWLGARGLRAMARESLGVWQAVHLDARVLALTMAVSLLTSVLLALAGAALGCVLARFAVQVLERLVWGVRPTDPATFAGVALLLLAVAAAASFVPTLRIARLNPAETLRQE